MHKRVTIVTHSGKFHADDVFATATLILLFGKRPVVAHIERTRDEAVIATGDFVLDVGSVYDPLKERFDHHQTGGAGTRANGIPYAAFGLVWKKYGAVVAGSEDAASMLDKNLVQFIDCLDNGIGALKPVHADAMPYTVDEIIDIFNPSWRDASPEYDERFGEAVNFASKILSREIKNTQDFLASKEIIESAYENARDKRSIFLEKNYQWGNILNKFPEPLFVVEPSYEHWRVGTVRDNPTTFDDRKKLPEAWAGKRDAELAQASGVPDAVFCHNKRFMAIAKTKEGALALAQKALDF